MKFAYLTEPPFNYREADGTVTGCDVELARHVLGELGETFEAVEAEFAELLPGLGRGRWRMTTGLFATSERKKHALFSRPIWALPDGLLVAKGNPLGLTGYRSSATARIRIAVIRDQVQHRAALDFGVTDDRLVIRDTYEQAAAAVAAGKADAYASVARAHTGHLTRRPELELDVVTVPASEKQAALGSFGFSLHDAALCRSIDAILDRFIGTTEHRLMMTRFGFNDAEIDLLT
ncbi:MAG: transporter substrate-binding domain-containing protein [Rhizobium sp.]|nr:transporter substrate-binding domain-containing protein [Rhizobium sp.]